VCAVVLLVVVIPPQVRVLMWVAWCEWQVRAVQVQAPLVARGMVRLLQTSHCHPALSTKSPSRSRGTFQTNTCFGRKRFDLYWHLIGMRLKS
jgi:hypothetical protein